jgi:hypothetical protein
MEHGPVAGMFSPMVVMGLVVILALVGIVALSMFFFRRAVPIARLRLADCCTPVAEAPRVQLPVAESAATVAADTAIEQDAYLILPDISGYTRFVNLSRFSFAHAQHVISELLDAIIAASSPFLRPAKLEGDAVFLCGQASADGLSEKTLSRVIELQFDAFYARRARLESNNSCPCTACRHLAELELKVVAHRGPVLLYRLHGFEELGGLPVIVAHRLLKNSLPLRRYVLMTEDAFAGVPPCFDVSPQRHVERYDDLGEVVLARSSPMSCRCRIARCPWPRAPRTRAGCAPRHWTWRTSSPATAMPSALGSRADGAEAKALLGI